MSRRELLIAAGVLGLAGCADGAPSPAPQLGRFDLEVDGAPDIPVHWVCGRGEPRPDTPVLLVLHGVERNGEEYRDSMAQVVAGREVLVLCPTFSQDDFPGSRSYNLGGIVDEDGDLRDRASWTYEYLPRVFAEGRRRLGVQGDRYDLFGHSAGAQVVHRVVELCPDHPVRRAVAANAGWYTMIDDDVDFPYGLRDLPAPIDLARAFAVELTILLGEDDVDDENLRTDDEADAQGPTRVERGRAFFDQAQQVAQDRGLRLAWRLRTVEGVGHDHLPMARAAMRDLGLA